jgi:multidrug resistance efflux pump
MSARGPTAVRSEAEAPKPAAPEPAPPAAPEPAPPPIPQPPPPPAAAPRPADPVRRWIIAVAALIAVIFIYSLIADRLTPFTNDARVNAFIVRMSPEVAGRVVEIGVRENEYVQAGTMLFRIDDQPYRIAVQRAEAGLDAATQQLGATSAAVSTAQANVTAATVRRDNLKLQVERTLELVAEGIETKARGDRDTSALAEAEAALAAAMSELDRAEQQLGPEGQNAQMQQALHDLEAAQLDLFRTQVVAPSDGVVTNLQLDIGQLASVGQPALTFIDSRYIWIIANMRENNLEHLAPDVRAEVVLDALPGRVFEARIDSVGWGVAGGTATDGATGLPTIKPASEWLLPAQNFPVRIEFVQGMPQGARFNSRAAVVAYATDNPIVNSIAWLWIRVLSYATFVY